MLLHPSISPPSLPPPHLPPPRLPPLFLSPFPSLFLPFFLTVLQKYKSDWNLRFSYLYLPSAGHRSDEVTTLLALKENSQQSETVSGESVLLKL